MKKKKNKIGETFFFFFLLLLTISCTLTEPDDGDTPTAGSGLTFSTVASTSMTVSWGAATDNVTAQANLQYKLVKASSSAAIDTAVEVDAISGADLVMDWTANTHTKAVSGLTASTTYYFNVAVKDPPSTYYKHDRNSPLK